MIDVEVDDPTIPLRRDLIDGLLTEIAPRGS